MTTCQFNNLSSPCTAIFSAGKGQLYTCYYLSISSKNAHQPIFHFPISAPRGPGYWRFNNSLLSDNEYLALLRSKIPEFVEKYKEVEDKGLFWEMVKMEIRGLTVRFSKLKTKRNRDEENLLSSRFAQLSAKLQTAYSEDDKAELA